MTETTPTPEAAPAIPTAPAAVVAEVVPDITAVISDVARLRADVDQIIHHPSEATVTQGALDTVVTLGAVATLAGAVDGIVGVYVPALNPVAGAILAGAGFAAVVIGNVVKRFITRT